MTRLDVPADADLPVAVGQLAPEIWAASRHYSSAVYASSQLPLREFEAARIRIAQINGCLRCLAFRTWRDRNDRLDRTDEIDDAFYEQVRSWRESTMFTERERLAIEFAERYAHDHLSFEDDEEFWSRLRARFADPELVDLGLSVAAFLGLGRFAHVFGTDVNCVVPGVNSEEVLLQG